MTVITDLFFMIRTVLQDMISLILGTLNCDFIMLTADIVLWFVWLWVVYHIFAKPFISVLSCILKLFKNPMFNEIEEGE